jgi:hypothetical protein
VVAVVSRSYFIDLFRLSRFDNFSGRIHRVVIVAKEISGKIATVDIDTIDCLSFFFTVAKTVALSYFSSFFDIGSCGVVR